MDDKIFDKIHEVDLKERMETFYIDYAMSVIASRALPDVRDGLKPVQRRILYAMIELNNGPDKPHRKCARIVGDTMGKYHPHGDSSIYGALVNMAQDWSTRYPLVDGHGNFGSMDGDGAAAMRYTEARLSKISMEMMADINKDTVDFQPNFDETEKEPVVLPSRYPNLLVNGTTGIAVGMATNIPPHNLRETIDGVIKIIDNRVEENRETTIEELMEIIKGPDFPTGAMILGKNGINQAYRTGRGKLKVRAVTDIETMPNGRHRIVATELPYMVNKAKLIEKIAELVKDKRIEGISDLRDESSREGLRVVIELKKDASTNYEDIQGLYEIVCAEGMQQNVSWFSFDYDYMLWMKEIAPTADIGIVLPGKASLGITEDVFGKLENLKTGINTVFVSDYARKISPAVLLRCKEEIDLVARDITSMEEWYALDPYYRAAFADAV